MRIDAANAELLSSEQLAAQPELLKILFRGTVLDLEVFKRISTSKIVSLDSYWRSYFGEYKRKPRQAGNGYQLLRDSTKKPQDATHLWDLPELSVETFLPLLINTQDCPPFRRPLLHRARQRDIYRKPLLIVHESPPVSSGRIRVAVAESDLVFNQSYHGYSAHGHQSEDELVRYLALLLGSKVAFWLALITSGRFGVEREVVEKIIIDHIPIVPFESLNADALARIEELFNAIVQDDSPENWAKVDAWAASLYGLNEQDLQVIDDTLRYNLPFAANKRAAQQAPSKSEVATFCSTLTNELAPWGKRESLQIEVQSLQMPAASPWSVLCITVQGDEKKATPTDEWPEILKLADRLASTEVILPDPDNCRLWIARLNQARYWSHSQARLVARRIVWEHLDTLFGSEAE
jgi:hypothetical protein